MEKLIKKWEEIGFLKNVKNKNNVAIALEYSAERSLGGHRGDFYSSIIFPIVHHVIGKIEDDKDKKDIKIKVDELFKGLCKLLDIW